MKVDFVTRNTEASTSQMQTTKAAAKRLVNTFYTDNLAEISFLFLIVSSHFLSK
jgi:hypothetical protein